MCSDIKILKSSSNGKNGQSFTEYEEDIRFDDDDPDFHHNQEHHVMPSLTLPIFLSAPENMVLPCFSSIDHHSSQSSLCLSDEWDGETGSASSADQVTTIEQLRCQLASCFTCGVSWKDRHVSLDCSECGGYSMDRPCADCDGQCSSIWKRDLQLSHSSGKARWIGTCLEEVNELSDAIELGELATKETLTTVNNHSEDTQN